MNKQEQFWQGQFGDDYSERCKLTPKLLANRIVFWSKILDKTKDIKSIIEFGANIGINLQAIKLLLPTADITAIEINKNACEKLKEFNVINQSVLDYKVDKKYDLAFFMGVLIHINPDKLKDCYEKVYNSSSKYYLIAEYYNPTPVEVNYRGNDNVLFKRDFAGEFMDLYNVKLIDYGFVWKRDEFPIDDVTWFLMEKINN